MAKKSARRAHHRHHKVVRATRASRGAKNDLVLVRGWMFVVAFALMLGVGALVGTFFNQLLNETTPMVAGAFTGN